MQGERNKQLGIRALESACYRSSFDNCTSLASQKQAAVFNPTVAMACD